MSMRLVNILKRLNKSINSNRLTFGHRDRPRDNQGCNRQKKLELSDFGDLAVKQQTCLELRPMAMEREAMAAIVNDR